MSRLAAGLICINWIFSSGFKNTYTKCRQKQTMEHDLKNKNYTFFVNVLYGWPLIRKYILPEK